MSFLDFLRILGHLLRGRTKLYQCYTNVNWRTCPECLSWHGRIVASPQGFPACDSCAHEVLAFSVWQLPAFRAKARAMAFRAKEELRRRELFRKGVELLPRDGQEALTLFDQAGAVDVYLPELEDLAREEALLSSSPELRRALGEVFLRRWKAKFAKERYERQPELARTEQEQYGVRRIQELFL